MKGRVLVYVVGHECSVPAHRVPGTGQLEVQVAIRMEAVVDEEVDRADVGEEAGKHSSACPAKKAPSRPQVLRDRRPDLGVKPTVERRTVDAPEVARAGLLQRLENNARRYPARDSGLDGSRRPQVDGETPDGPGEGGVGVVPAAERSSADREALRPQLRNRLRVELVEARALGTRPGGGDQRVQTSLPRVGRLECVERLRSVPSSEPQQRAVKAFYGVFERESRCAATPKEAVEDGWVGARSHRRSACLLRPAYQAIGARPDATRSHPPISRPSFNAIFTWSGQE
jgi:hypothetical protein